MPDLIQVVNQLVRGDPGLWIAAIGALALLKLFWDVAARYANSEVVVFCFQAVFLLGASYLMINFLL
jgi:hypothetical protein